MLNVAPGHTLTLQFADGAPWLWSEWATSITVTVTAAKEWASRARVEITLSAYLRCWSGDDRPAVTSSTSRPASKIRSGVRRIQRRGDRVLGIRFTKGR